MKKLLLISLFIATSVMSQEKVEDLPLQCVDNPDDWGVAQQYVSEANKQKLTEFEKQAKKQWQALQDLVKTDDFKQYGKGSNTYKKWADENNTLGKALGAVKGVAYTDYEQCLQALIYATAFQSDYAGGAALNSRVDYYKSEVEKQFKLLEKRK